MGCSIRVRALRVRGDGYGGSGETYMRARASRRVQAYDYNHGVVVNEDFFFRYRTGLLHERYERHEGGGA